MCKPGKARCARARTRLVENRAAKRLLRPDLLLKVERCGVGRILGERVAKHLAGFREPARLDETAREGDAEIVRVRRADASPEELDRCIGVPKLPRRFRRYGVETRERWEERDGLLLALDRALVVAERVLNASEAIEGVRILRVGRDGEPHRLVRGVARAWFVLLRELLLHTSEIPPKRRRVGRPRRRLPVRDTRAREIRHELEGTPEVVPVHRTARIDRRR